MPLSSLPLSLFRPEHTVFLSPLQLAPSSAFVPVLPLPPLGESSPLSPVFSVQGTVVTYSSNNQTDKNAHTSTSLPSPELGAEGQKVEGGGPHLSIEYIIMPPGLFHSILGRFLMGPAFNSAVSRRPGRGRCGPFEGRWSISPYDGHEINSARERSSTS